MPMAIEGYHHHDSLPSTTRMMRDSLPDASLITNADHVSGAYSTQPFLGPPSAPGSALKKRRLAKQKAGRTSNRSVSTPQLRGHVMSDSEADKKRNKLGYQRISIACAHCRRRKIRCLVADGDPQSRCQNCIRLKKECVFYPVEQQGILESKSQSSKTGGETGPSSTVSSSPPEIGIGRPFDERQDGSTFPTLPSNAPATLQSLPLEPGTALLPQGSFMHPEYAYTQRPIQPWTPTHEFAPGASPVQQEQLHPMNHNFTRYNHAPSPGDVAPLYNETMLPPPEPHSAHAAPSFQYQQRRDAYWQSHQHLPQPLRSMSYDQIGSIPSNDPYAVSYHSVPPHQYSHMRHMPLSIEMQAPGMAPETSGPHSAPVRDYRHAFADQNRPYMIPPEMQAMQNVGARAAYTNHWYQPSPPFAPVTEEAADHVPHEPSKYTGQDNRPG